MRATTHATARRLGSGAGRHVIPGRVGYALAAALSLLVVLAQWLGRLGLPLDTAEVVAFVSGGWTVWLAARNNPWTWPIGVVNSLFFVALFWDATLYFDSALNAFYVLSGLWGWWIWLFGGARRTERPIGRVGRREAGALAVVGVAAALAMWRGGLLLGGAAPALDAVTTALSLVAQWLMMRRLYEHWYVWIAADLLYVPLYLSRGLPLTAVLYAIFLLMCLRGLVEWRALLRRRHAAELAPPDATPAPATAAP
jgi:nicotinamide mononucleotide transporter